ncbi:MULTISPECIES: DUF6660 family protein [Aquirufa]|nr:DUF6660 family protein [Aquirufa antheringensis]
MKFFAFIMSIYLLVLSCLPCIDRQERNVMAEQKISATTQQQQHQTGDEACTPFCTCSHCPASAFSQPLALYKMPKMLFQSVKFHYEIVFNSYDFHSVWQPPKIG